LLTNQGVMFACVKNVNNEQNRELRLPTDQGVTSAYAKKIIINRGVTSLRTR
jgi:hypothetical protein